MSPGLQVAVYSAVIFLTALTGGLIPIFGGKRARSVTFLAFAAGIMLGAAFFEMLPEAFHKGGYQSFAVVPIGFLALFLLERYVLVHVCEEPPECEEHGHGKPSALGLTAFLGMSAHTLFDGVALASSVLEGIGLTALVAITAHKFPSSLSLASILHSERAQKKVSLLYIVAFGLMVPMGAGIYLLLDSALHFETFSARALAFSAGTFLYISVSDLLPHVNRHGKDHRFIHIVALGAGLGLMFGLAQLLPHEH
ncbi:MAG: ZIP family metal transporter [Myxococcaceae bacterium]